MPVPMSTILLAAAVDRLTALVYTHTKKGTQQPGSLVTALLGAGKGKEKDLPGSVKTETFETAADYEAARARLLEGVT